MDSKKAKETRNFLAKFMGLKQKTRKRLILQKTRIFGNDSSLLFLPQKSLKDSNLRVMTRWLVPPLEKKKKKSGKSENSHLFFVLDVSLLLLLPRDAVSRLLVLSPLWRVRGRFAPVLHDARDPVRNQNQPRNTNSVRDKIQTKKERKKESKSSTKNPWWMAELVRAQLQGGDSPNLNIVLRSVSTHVSKCCLWSKMFAKHLSPVFLSLLCDHASCFVLDAHALCSVLHAFCFVLIGVFGHRPL
jgi:DNA mismatch repair ATPase MutS